jgi:Protein of unknown function (DUF4054)
MGVVVTPTYSAWSGYYPSLAPYIDEAAFNNCFNLAQLYQANDGSGPINDPLTAIRLMGLMIAHIAVLTYPTTGPVPGGSQPPDPVSPLVGRISNATEGSVNVAAQNDYPPGSAQWFQQSVWGSAWWEATAQFRTMRYAPSRIGIGPYGPFGFINRAYGSGFGRG